MTPMTYARTSSADVSIKQALGEKNIDDGREDNIETT